MILDLDLFRSVAAQIQCAAARARGRGRDWRLDAKDMDGLMKPFQSGGAGQRIHEVRVVRNASGIRAEASGSPTVARMTI